MGVKSVRFNSDEEKALAALTSAFHMDTSGVIKDFEVREDAGDTGFTPIDDLLDRSNS